MPENSDKKPRGKGRPIKKGQVLNPHGRPKKEESITNIMREFLGGLEIGDSKIDGNKAIVQKIFQLAMQGDVGMLKYMCDRVDGTPVASVKQVDDNGKAIKQNVNLKKLSKEEKDLLAKIVVDNMGIDD